MPSITSRYLPMPSISFSPTPKILHAQDFGKYSIDRDQKFLPPDMEMQRPHLNLWEDEKNTHLPQTLSSGQAALYSSGLS